MSSVAPAASRIVAIALAVAAVVVLAFTALADCGGPKPPSAGPSRTISPVPASTEPDSIPLPTTEPTYKVPATSGPDAAARLAALAGRWVLPSDQKSYFQFGDDGSGTWVVYGRQLWSGKAVPRSGRYYDLTQNGQGASYMRVRLLTGGRRLYFEGSQQTFRKA